MSIKRHLAYLRYVLRHKYYVWRGGRIVGGVSWWRLLVHDWDKFLPDEWFPYARTFYKPDGTSQYVETPEFTMAWNRHQKRNRHHWQWWLITWDRGETDALPMAEVDLCEMVADWIGAGWAITGQPNPLPWYEQNKTKMILNEQTRIAIERLLNGVATAL